MTLLATIIFSNRTWSIPIALAALVLIASIIWSWRSSAVEPWLKATCGLLKLAGIIALALCLLDPLWVGERARPGANIFGVIADNSQSLKIKDAAQTQSRGEILREQLIGGAKGWRSALDEN